MSLPVWIFLGYLVNFTLMVGGIVAVFYLPAPNVVIGLTTIALMLGWFGLWLAKAPA